MLLPLIGLLGRAGSGKDTVADALVLRHGVTKVALADPIKRAAQAWFGWTDEDLWGPSENRAKADPDGLTRRKALQFIGTEVGRSLRRDMWVNQTIQVAKMLLTPSVESFRWQYTASRGLVRDALDSPAVGGVAVSDVRFQNEVDAICAAGGEVWRILRPGAGLRDAAGQHLSETEQECIPEEAFCLTIHNDKDLVALHAQVDEAFARWAQRAAPGS